MKIDDLSAPSGRFVTRVTATVTTADTAFASVFAVPSEGGTGSAEGPAAATSFARHAPPSSNISQGANPAAITDPAASAPSPRGDPALPTALPLSGRISTRACQGTVTTAGTEPPAVGYGFGPGGVPRPSVRRANTPPRFPRPRPPLAVPTAPAPAASPAPMAPIPSGRKRAEPMSTPILRISPFPDVPFATTANPWALLPSHNSGIPPHAIRTLIRRGNNRSSLGATPPRGTSLLTGRQPYQTTFGRVSLRISAPPSRRFRSLLATAGYTPPTMAPSCSSANRLRNPRPDSQRRVGRAA